VALECREGRFTLSNVLVLFESILYALITSVTGAPETFSALIRARDVLRRQRRG
jgi:hypothetical protein